MSSLLNKELLYRYVLFFCSNTLVYPLDVYRIRKQTLMASTHSDTIISGLKEIIQLGGIKALFTGTFCTFSQSLIDLVISVTIELTKKYNPVIFGYFLPFNAFLQVLQLGSFYYFNSLKTKMVVNMGEGHSFMTVLRSMSLRGLPGIVSSILYLTLYGLFYSVTSLFYNSGVFSFPVFLYRIFSVLFCILSL